MNTPEEFGVTLDEDLQQVWNTNQGFVEAEIERLVKKQESWSDWMEKLVEDQIKIINIQRQRNTLGTVKWALIIFGVVVAVTVLYTLFFFR